MTETELINFVYRYFASERKTAFTDVALGLALVILAVVLWRSSGSASFQKGMAYPLIIAGLFLTCASAAYAPLVTRHTVSLVTEYRKMPAEDARALEEGRLSNIVNHAYTRAFWICTALIATGAAMFLLSHGVPVRRGVAYGLILIGMLGFATEGFSRHKNEQFLRAIQPRILAP